MMQMRVEDSSSRCRLVRGSQKGNDLMVEEFKAR